MLGLFLQGCRFLGAGAVATACHWLLLFLFVETGLLPPAAASCVGYALASALNYTLRRRYVFRSQAPHRRAAPRYLAVVAVGFGLNGAVMQLGSGVLGLPYPAVQLVATGAVFVWNFLAHHLWTFRETAPATAARPAPAMARAAVARAVPRGGGMAR